MFPVKAFQHTLKKLADILLQHEIPFHLTGGVTSIAYADPRMTQDIDIVVSNEKLTSNLESVISAVEASDFLFDEKSFRVAVEAHNRAAARQWMSANRWCDECIWPPR